MVVRVVRLGTPRVDGEGLRIGTVRRPPRGVPKAEYARRNWYDVWFPNLAPSVATLKLGQQAETAGQWSAFLRRYRAEMAEPEHDRAIALLAALSHGSNFSVGCYCEDEARCHRSVWRELLAARGARMAPPRLRQPLAQVKPMTQDAPLHDYLVLSRGHWDPDRTPEEIQTAIDAFYAWYERLLAEGQIKPGQRLAREGRSVSKTGVMDGPFTETKEVVGGYWFFVAHSLDEAAALAAQNPCMVCGLSYEVRPVEAKRASAYEVTNETPLALHRHE